MNSASCRRYRLRNTCLMKNKFLSYFFLCWRYLSIVTNLLFLKSSHFPMLLRSYFLLSLVSLICYSLMTLSTLLLFLDKTLLLKEFCIHLTALALAASYMFWVMWSCLWSSTPYPNFRSSSDRWNSFAVFSLNISLPWALKGIGWTIGSRRTWPLKVEVAFLGTSLM